MADVTCPHCKEEFDIFDHNDSGPYPCPECNKEIWVEVEYSVIYDASCMESDHEWERPGDPYPDGVLCTKCGCYRMEGQ